MTQPIARLANTHAGQTAYIVGKGPSLVNLTAGHFAEPGPIITINQAVRKIESLRVPNPILSMQKDGPYPVVCESPCTDCSLLAPETVRPAPRTALLVSVANSRHCLADHRRRYLFDTEADFGLWWRMPSVTVAVRLAERMGCAALEFVAMDVFTHDDIRTCTDGMTTVELDGERGYGYRDMPKLVAGLLAVSRIRDVRWVTP